MSNAMEPEAQPEELRVNAARDCLRVSFVGGARFDLPAEYLRVESPSAEVQGHAPEEKQTVIGKAAVKIVQLEPIGHYAVRIIFDDGHDSGYYTWDYLHRLGSEHQERWATYLEASAGL